MLGALADFMVEPLTDEGDEVEFDHQTQSWLVRSHAAAKQILRSEETFSRPDASSATARAVRGNNRSLAVLTGETHLRLHTYLTSRVGARASEHYRRQLIGPIVRNVLDRLDTSMPVDVASEVADRIPIRIGLAMIGFDVSDDGRVDEIHELKARFTRWSDVDRDDQELARLAAEASVSLKQILMPLIERRRTHPEDDLASEFWRTGPSVFADWDATDTYAACYAFLGGGETAYAIRNGLYVLLADTELRERLRTSPELVARLANEILRLYVPIQWLTRIAMSEEHIAGMTIKAGDVVRVLLPVANRDAHAYECAADVELGSDRRPRHLSFGHGSRYCIGASLARAEVEETLLLFVQAFPASRLVDVGRVRGHRIRSVAPIYARLT